MFKTRFISMLVLLMTAVTGAWATITVTWNSDDITGTGDGTSFTKDGVTITAGSIDFDAKNFMQDGTFTTTLGNFTKIEVTAFAIDQFSGTGWSGSDTKQTWTGNASSVSFNGNINGMVFLPMGNINFVFTIEPATVAVTGVTLAPTSATLTLGETETVTLIPTVLPGDATDKSVTWSSSNEAVATVADGVVTAVAAGEATITVTTTDGAKTATCAVTVAAPAASTYTVTLKEGTDDATSWTITPAEATTTGVAAGTEVKATYGGAKKVKSVKAVKAAAAPAGKTIDLSQVTESTTAEDGDVLLGALGANVKISIADGATVTLDNATINGVNSSDYAWAGLTCVGSATIILKDGTTNTVTGFCEGYPGIYVPTTGTVTIKGETEGTGVLNAQGCVSATYGNRTAGAGIGAGASQACGNIVIEGGVINATGGYACAAIGGAFLAACGDITITGGTVTASGSASAAGIGGGWYSTSGNIEITGGTVNASSNEVLNTTDGGPGIGCGALCVGGNITIGGTAHVTAQGANRAAGIGSGGTYNNVGSTCGNITIGGTAHVTAQGGNGGAGIGTGGAVVGNSICGDILINGGTVTATADTYGAGIGSGINSIGTTCQCGTITITSDVTKVTATKGTNPNSLCSIGAGYYYNDGVLPIMSSTSGEVTISGTVYWDGSAYQNGGDTYLTQSPLVYEP